MTGRRIFGLTVGEALLAALLALVYLLLGVLLMRGFLLGVWSWR